MKTFFILACSIFMACGLNAQILIKTPYPAPAQSLTRGLNQTTLTVQVSFTTSCSNSKVTIAFPASVTYVPGTVTQTGGTLSSGSGGITESNISNLNAPVFDILNVSGAGDITFTLSRQAGCGTLFSGKDTVKVTGSCGSAIENSANTNTYNILAPSLTLAPAAAITGAVLGDTYSRNTIITSAGNGCVDTVRFYIVYPLQGIKMQDAPVNTITAQINAGGGSATFTPWKTNGDTLFYKLFGAPFGDDNLLCNGESVKIIENIKVLTCGAATTTYAAGWAKTETLTSYCQTAIATSAMVMAAGVVNMGTYTYTAIQTMNWCRPGIYDITISNTGSGGKAGAAYNILQAIGYSSGTTGLPGDIGTNIQGRLDSVSINGVKVTLTGTALLSQLNMNQFTTDPDGAGIGLDDLDGDGQYDDLLPGKIYKIRIFEHWQTGSGCPIPSYNFSLRTSTSFNTMCSATITTTNQSVTSYYYQTTTTNPSAITAPAAVQGGQPFSLQSCEGMTASGSQPAYRPTDSVYLDIIIPAGVALSPTPNVTVNGTAITTASYTVLSGSGNADTVRIRRPRSGLLVFCYSIDLVYTCGTGGNLTFGMNHYYVGDASCGVVERTSCKTVTIPALCPGSCPGGGMGNYLATATRTSLGYTNETLTTRVTAASVTSPAKNTMLPLDTFNLISPGKQNGSFNNLYYTLTFGRIASQNLISFVSGTLNIKNAVTSEITSCVVTPVVSTTTTVQTLSYNLTTCLPGGVINNGDSVWLDQVFAVTAANNDLLLGGALLQIPNTLSRFYNVNGSNVSVYCGGTQFSIYTLGISRNRSANTITANGCTVAAQTIQVKNGFTTTIVDYFPNEYRPYDRFDSIKIQLPTGFIFNTAFTPTVSYQKWGTATTVTTTNMTGGLASYSGNTLVYKNPYNGSWFSADLGSVSNSPYAFGDQIYANCSAQATGTAPYTLYLTKYIYTGNPAVYASVADNATQSLNYNVATKPTITIQNNTGIVQGTTRQHFWDVQINSSGINTAPNLWMALEKGTGGITIDSVVLKPGNTVLAPLSYNTSDIWYKVSATGLASGSIQQARVYFKYTNCNLDSTLLKTGWDCAGYPINPASYACTAATTYLKVDPQVSQVQLNITRNSGNGSATTLCAMDSILAVINSSQSAYLVNPYVEVYPPTGITIQTPVKIEYPLGSGNYQNAAVTAISGGYKVDLSAHTGIGTTGMPGTSQNPGAAGRQAKLKIDITTDCGFTSGTTLRLAAFGTRPCQALATGSGILNQTGPVTVVGATTAGSAGISLNIPVSVLDCGQNTTLTLTATPAIQGTQGGDTVLYNLPAGLQYNGNFAGDANCASCTADVVAGVAGTTTVKVKLQTSVAAGTALSYHFDVMASGIGCGAVTISGAVKRDIAGVSCGSTSCSGSSVIIGTANSPAITIRKPDLSTNSFNFVQDGGSYPHWISYSFNLYNNGTLAAASNRYIVKIFCGMGATGQVLETIVANAVGAGSFINQTGGFLLNSVADCPRGSLLSIQVQDTMAGGAKNCLCASPASSTSSVVLPVKLESFTAILQNGTVAIQWKVADENDLAGYEVEYSRDGRNFHTLTTVATSNARTYHTTHNDPAEGNNYYRLKIVSKDGSVVYSSIEVVKAEAINKDISIYPNPIRRMITMRMNTSLIGKQASLTILTIDGRIIMQKSFAALGQLETVDVGNLANGKYIIRMMTSDRFINKKIVVNH